MHIFLRSHHSDSIQVLGLDEKKYHSDQSAIQLKEELFPVLSKLRCCY